MAGATSGSDAHRKAKIGENENENENFFFRMWAVVKVILTKGSSKFTTVVDVAGSSSNVNRVGVSYSDRFDDVDVGGMNNIIEDVDFGVMDEPTVEDSPLLRDIITTASDTYEVEVTDTSRPVRSCTIRSSPSTSNA
ncbi:unnamed protein product [Rhodiola kirilowii]